MKITIGLYDNDGIDFDRARKQILKKDPVIFIVPNTAKEEIYKLVNVSQEYASYIYVNEYFSIPKVFSYLLSFNDLDKKSVLVVAPKADLGSIKVMAIKLCTLINGNTRAKAEMR